MGLKRGTRIASMADLKERCIVSAITGCWRWQGSMHNGTPAVWTFDRSKDCCCVVSGPRAAALMGGLDLFAGWRAWMTCTRRDCVNPLHATTGTIAQWGKWMAEQDRLKNSPRRVRATKERWERRYPERAAVARMVRESDETGRALAARLQLPEQTISKMRLGMHWAEGTNAFTGLGARIGQAKDVEA
jgi:hypothetical protein